MTHLLDTDVCVAVLRGMKAVQERLRMLSPDDVGVSTVSIYELFAGVERCRDPRAEGRKVERFLAPLHILTLDRESARRAAKVRAKLQESGTVIGPYDLLLAGQALALEVKLVTRNTREFSRVAGLKLEDWLS
ncbi:MAG: type II toxin-antitoxin system VapC family toxin [Chthoniobacterales bacterium]|nr:type II toxin-antitoxin system VapC family toxin [Chthoniobacterales bacterium]